MWLFGRARVRDLQSLELTIANSKVMGAASATLAAVAALIAGVAQLVGVWGSNVVTEFGGLRLDVAWAVSLIMGGVLVLAARVRESQDPVDGAWLEAGGLLILAVCLQVYVTVIIKQGGGLDGRLFVVLMLSSTAINLCGRALLLVRRIVWIWRAAR